MLDNFLREKTKMAFKKKHIYKLFTTAASAQEQ